MLATILRAHYGADRVLATRANLNNAIGLPLTLLGLRADHRAAVVELGMNHRGETALLAAIAQPTVALINNAQREHQEFLPTVEDAARANGEVLAEMAPNGTVILNADDACIEIWRALAGGRRIVTFGIEQPADVRGACCSRAFGSQLEITSAGGSASVSLQLSGIHNARNALAAAAAAWAAGVPLDVIAAALAGVTPVAGRLVNMASRAGATVIDDTYNANPDSVRAAIDVLAALPSPRVLVLGDMGEVGDQGPEFHREIGAYAKSRGIDALLGLGDMTGLAVKAFGEGGMHAGTVDALLELLAPYDRPASNLLIKGSRFMRMERVVAALTGVAAGGAH
jgi:UDP-N-acetylmuramoyl-tripeptide--D-alanyl-D-alanine ligase